MYYELNIGLAELVLSQKNVGSTDTAASASKELAESLTVNLPRRAGQGVTRRRGGRGVVRNDTAASSFKFVL